MRSTSTISIIIYLLTSFCACVPQGKVCLSTLCLMRKLSRGEIVSPSLQPLSCNSCYIAADFTYSSQPINAGQFTFNPGGSLIPERSSPTGTYIVFTAYSVTSAYGSSGQCFTTSNSPITLATPFSLTKPSITDSVSFQAAAETSFVNYLRFSTCSGRGQSVQASRLVPVSGVLPMTITTSGILGLNGVLPTSTIPILVPVVNASTSSTVDASLITPANATSQPPTSPLLTNTISTPSSSTAPTPKSNPTSGKAAAGAAEAIGSIALLVIGVFLWRRYRKYFKKPLLRGSLQDGPLPFLQRKAELEAEERRRHELHDGDTRPELETREVRPELHGGVRWQELRGEEHSQELEART